MSSAAPAEWPFVVEKSDERKEIVPVVKAEEFVSKVPPGTYEIAVKSTESYFMENDRFGQPHKVKIVVDVLLEDGPEQLDAICNEKLTPMSTLWRWLEAFDVKPELGMEYDTDLLIGKHALAVIGERVTEKGTWPRIEDFVPLPKGGRPAEKTTADILKFNGKGDPQVDWTTFWLLMRKHGINQKNVEDEYGDIKEADPFNLPEMADALIAKTQG